jgi:hypothetical protein
MQKMMTSILTVKGAPEIESVAKAEVLEDSKEKDEIALTIVKKAFKGLGEAQKKELLELLKD